MGFGVPVLGLLVAGGGCRYRGSDKGGGAVGNGHSGALSDDSLVRRFPTCHSDACPCQSGTPSHALNHKRDINKPRYKHYKHYKGSYMLHANNEL